MFARFVLRTLTATLLVTPLAGGIALGSPVEESEEILGAMPAPPPPELVPPGLSPELGPPAAPAPIPEKRVQVRTVKSKHGRIQCTIETTDEMVKTVCIEVRRPAHVPAPAAPPAPFIAPAPEAENVPPPVPGAVLAPIAPPAAEAAPVAPSPVAPVVAPAPLPPPPAPQAPAEVQGPAAGAPPVEPEEEVIDLPEMSALQGFVGELDDAQAAKVKELLDSAERDRSAKETAEKKAPASATSEAPASAPATPAPEALAPEAAAPRENAKSERAEKAARTREEHEVAAEARKAQAVEAEILRLLNEVRFRRGAPALTLDAKMSEVARAHSTDMCGRRYFDHVSLEGKQPWDRLREAGVSFEASAENIAKGDRSAEKLNAGFLASPGHATNRLNPVYTRVGLGLCTCGGAGETTFTEIFAK
jgi:uncharacterized protein YkwD